ncbi:hypothetical protein R9C00_01740 [Flammeovirgaceae bacterium SG7u.111]|nr:hypothetical protein [Flammeovirgaceae bacterium SG7u.132]WPO36164.1 hypothetical protein R9C00_01740 [Flammeovirgaceae bacterium SG7u.111]
MEKDKLPMLDIDISEYIPQRPPFVLITGVTEVDEQNITTIFEVPEGHVLEENGTLKAGGLIENIAQSAAFYAGYSYKKNGQEIPIGFISSVKGLETTRLPLVGETITTKVSLVNEVMDFKIFEGKVWDEKQELLARCELRVFTQKG